MINILIKFGYWFVYTISSLFSLFIFDILPKVSLWRFYQGDMIITEIFNSKFEKEEHISYISNKAKKRIIEDFISNEENYNLLIKIKIETDKYHTTLYSELKRNIDKIK